jgi:5-exo-hydroxycamphor dehydrogenase
MVLGHEGVGTIAKLGRGVVNDSAGARIRHGDRVYWAPLLACQRCYHCSIENDPSACEAKQIYGAVGSANWNTYADFALLPAGIGFYHVPDDVPSAAVVAFGCALPTVLQAMDRLGEVRAGSDVVIQGVGPVGLAAVVAMRAAGAGRIVVLDRHERRLDLAAMLGASHTLVVNDCEPSQVCIEKVRNLCEGRGAQIAVEASGSIAAFSQGIGMIANGGRYLIVGLWSGTEQASIQPSYVLCQNLRIIGSAYASPKHYFASLKLLERSDRLDRIVGVVQKELPMTQLLDAFDWVAQGGAGKAIILPHA